MAWAQGCAARPQCARVHVWADATLVKACPHICCKSGAVLCCDVLQDDIERLLEYVAIGPRFSNVVLQVG